MSPAKKPAAKKGASKRTAVKKAATRVLRKVTATAKKLLKRPGALKAAGGGSPERGRLLSSLAKQLRVTAAEVELRALRELSERISAAGKAATQPAAAERASLQTATFGGGAQEAAGSLPKRLFLLLDGRGLDGHGLPIEVIDSPTTVGSGKFCTIWVNAPQIETRHLQITEEPEGWVLKDLGTAKGTLLGETPVQRRVIRHGDEYRLAGYLRLRAELR